jgi:hypothetical protein
MSSRIGGNSKKRKYSSVVHSPGSSVDGAGSSKSKTYNTKNGSSISVVSRIGSVLGSVIDTFRSPKPKHLSNNNQRNSDININNNNDNTREGTAFKSTSSRFNYNNNYKQVEQPQATIRDNKRVRTPTSKTVKLTPELISLVQEGTITEEQARNIMLDDIKCNKTDKLSKKITRTTTTVTSQADNNPNHNDSEFESKVSFMSPKTKKAQEIPWEEATKYILLDTSYGMQTWLWKALKSLGWTWTRGLYCPPGCTKAMLRDISLDGIEYFSDRNDAIRYVDRIRRAPYIDFDCSSGMGNGGWTKLKNLGWKWIHGHKLYNSLFVMPGVERKDIIVGYNSFETGHEAIQFISMLKGDDDDSDGDSNDEEVKTTSRGRRVINPRERSKRKKLERIQKKSEEKNRRGRGKRKIKPRVNTFATEQYQESKSKSKMGGNHTNNVSNKGGGKATSIESTKIQDKEKEVEKRHGNEEKAKKTIHTKATVGAGTSTIPKKMRVSNDKSSIMDINVPKNTKGVNKKGTKNKKEVPDTSLKKVLMEKTCKNIEKNMEKSNNAKSSDSSAESSSDEESSSAENSSAEDSSSSDEDKNDEQIRLEEENIKLKKENSKLRQLLKRKQTMIDKLKRNNIKLQQRTKKILSDTSKKLQAAKNRNANRMKAEHTETSSSAESNSSGEEDDDDDEEEISSSNVEDGEEEKDVSPKLDIDSENSAVVDTRKKKVYYSSLKSIHSKFLSNSPKSPRNSRKPISIPTFTLVDDKESSSNGEGNTDIEEEHEDTSVEAFISRHYWHELEEQNDSLYTWLRCDSCGKRRKVNRAHPVLRGLRDYYYCGNGTWSGTYEDGKWVPSDIKCSRPCGWISHNVGVEKAKELLRNNILLVEDILFDKNIQEAARTLNVVLEHQTLKPCVLNGKNFASNSYHASSIASNGNKNYNDINGGSNSYRQDQIRVTKTPTPLKKRVPYNYPNSRDV